MSINICPTCGKHIDEDYEVEHYEECKLINNPSKETAPLWFSTLSAFSCFLVFFLLWLPIRNSYWGMIPAGIWGFFLGLVASGIADMIRYGYKYRPK